MLMYSIHQGSKPPPPDSRTPLRACNGFAYLCDRPYDTVTYATVHNAMSSLDDGFAVPNNFRFAVPNNSQQLPSRDPEPL